MIRSLVSSKLLNGRSSGGPTGAGAHHGSSSCQHGTAALISLWARTTKVRAEEFYHFKSASLPMSTIITACRVV